jgi:hypothetical protein
MSKPECPSAESSVSAKGSNDPTLTREWTPLSVADERRQLEQALTCAREVGDEEEVKRITARLRLLTP